MGRGAPLIAHVKAVPTLRCARIHSTPPGGDKKLSSSLRGPVRSHHHVSSDQALRDAERIPPPPNKTKHAAGASPAAVLASLCPRRRAKSTSQIPLVPSRTERSRSSSSARVPIVRGGVR